jgi:hypothetical protein
VTCPRSCWEFCTLIVANQFYTTRNAHNADDLYREIVTLYYAELSKCFTSIIQAVYFSWVTITTTGYGDFTPKHSISRLMCMWELAVGLILVVLAVGTISLRTTNLITLTRAEGRK